MKRQHHQKKISFFFLYLSNYDWYGINQTQSTSLNEAHQIVCHFHFYPEEFAANDIKEYLGSRNVDSLTFPCRNITMATPNNDKTALAHNSQNCCSRFYRLTDHEDW